MTSYKYLGHEIKPRIGLAWAAYGKLKYIFRSDIPLCLKRTIFNQCILPVMYGSQTSKLTKKSVNKVRVKQRAMERSLLKITIRDKVPNEIIRQRTRVTDASE